MTTDVHRAAIDAVQKSMSMPESDRRDYLEMLGCVAIHFMRATDGDEYTRGWLEHALSDLDRPPILQLETMQ